MADRALAYLIIGNVWGAAALATAPRQSSVTALVVATVWLALSWTTDRADRRHRAAVDNLNRDVAAARYREATDA